MLDFNTEPYNDDFDEDNKFHRILFRPSFAVQARELTQLQTILQKQIERNGSHMFKNGAMVVPGQISLDNNVPSFLNKMGCAFIGCENKKEQIIIMNNFFIKNVKDVYS